MEKTTNGFNLNYELVDYSSIRVTKKGKNDMYEWGDSLTFRSLNVYTIQDEELGELDKEELIDFKIPCENLTEAAELNKLIRTLQRNGVVLNLNGYLPRKIDGNPILTVQITDKPIDLFKKYHSAMTKTESKTEKAS